MKSVLVTPRHWIKPEILGTVVVGDKTDNVKKHGIEAGILAELFDPPQQRISPVLAKDFKEVIPVLLVSLLGARAYGRVGPGQF